MVDETEVNTFNSQSSSLIKLNNGTVLYLREVNKFLALVCILREENFQKQGNFFLSCILSKVFLESVQTYSNMVDEISKKNIYQSHSHRYLHISEKLIK